MDLKNIRVEIDSIDEQIVELFKRRMDCSVKVAESKIESGTPVLNPKREEEIMNKVEELGGEYGKYARKPALRSSRDGYLWELTGWTQGSQGS